MAAALQYNLASQREQRREQSAPLSFDARSGNPITFERLEVSNLTSGPVLIQALDNQWLPSSLLLRIMHTGYMSQHTRSVLRNVARTAYLWALIHCQQIVINRAFIYNNAVISQDYVQRGQRRAAFRMLLEDGAIIPYLYTEQTPLERPSFGVDQVGFSSWQQICQETFMRCLRLSWDDTSNIRMTQMYLARRFHNFALTLLTGDLDLYIDALGLDRSAYEQLRSRFLEVARLCIEVVDQGRLISRNDLYKAFVVGGENPAERQYDSAKPFSAEIKQLLDLAYNCYLADALGGYLIIPGASLQRASLQEKESYSHVPEIPPERVVGLFRAMEFQSAGLHNILPTLRRLQLQDIRALRQTEEWFRYINDLEELRHNPLRFAEQAMNVYRSYIKIVEIMTKVAASVNTVAWTPMIECVLHLAGAELVIRWTVGIRSYRFAGNLSALGEASLAIVRFIIKDEVGTTRLEDSQRGLDVAIDFLWYQARDIRRYWSDLQQLMRELPDFVEQSS